MISVPENQWGTIALAGAAVVVAGSLYFARSPLQSQRPREPAGAMVTSSGQEVVMARLWQDPLDAIQRHWNATVSSSGTARDSPPANVRFPVTIKDFDPAPAQLVTQPRQSPSEYLRLVVMLPGTPYVQDRERRRRQRYAVVSALTEHGFIPDNTDHIGYIVAPSFEGSSARSFLIGFERYEPGFEVPDDDEEAESENTWKFVIVFLAQRPGLRPLSSHSGIDVDGCSRQVK